jgi:hypothetical protein
LSPADIILKQRWKKDWRETGFASVDAVRIGISEWEYFQALELSPCLSIYLKKQ